MTIATLKLDIPTKLAFDVAITGASGVPESRFVIEHTMFNISYPCVATNSGVEVNIDGLASILSAGEYKAKLEIVLENKIYTPLRDTITFEPAVQIATKKVVIDDVRESISVGMVKVITPVINEDLLRKTQAATIIAKSLDYHPSNNESPQKIIENAIEQTTSMTSTQLNTLKNMLELARGVGLEISEDFLPDENTQPVKIKDEESDEDIEEMISYITDWEHIVDAYEPGELVLIDDETGEVIDELSDELIESELNEVLSRAERIKSKLRFARTAGKRQRAIRIALRKHSSNVVINKRARQLAVKLMKTKLAKGRPFATIGFNERARIERILARKSKFISRLALKLTSRIRSIEKTRLNPGR